MDIASGQGKNEESEQVRVRFEKLEKLIQQGKAVYPNTFRPTHLAELLHGQYDEKGKEELEALQVGVSVSGRVMAIRDFGKAAFVRVQDRSGIIQLFIQRDKLSSEAYDFYKHGLDVGDLVFSEGKLFKTKTNELSIQSTQFELVSKSLRPLPEKYHGIADVEIKYRQRYLDLMMSQETRDTFRKRSLLIEELRRFFIEEGYLEVETPMMHPIAGGATARPFVTHHNALDMTLYMRIAPELYLKRLLVGGLERVFEINRNFRNEGISIKHNPEFTMVEFYQAYATYIDFMELHERLFQRICKKLYGKESLTYQGTEIHFSGKWKTIRVEDAVLEYSGFKDRAKIRDRETLLQYGKTKGLPMNPKDSVGGLMMVIFDEEVEGQLIQPTFVTHYPLDVSPLSRKNDQDSFLVDRFELYIFGREMANAFSELNDPLDQKQRFESQAEAKKAGNEEAFDMDLDYITALEYAMPPAAGAGIGIDRLTMLFTDSPSIRDVILFPLMRQRGQAGQSDAGESGG